MRKYRNATIYLNFRLWQIKKNNREQPNKKTRLASQSKPRAKHDCIILFKSLFTAMNLR